MRISGDFILFRSENRWNYIFLQDLVIPFFPLLVAFLVSKQSNFKRIIFSQPLAIVNNAT